MLEHKRIVFTGGPSSGKTSVLNNIQLPHIHCFEEVSRKLISEGTGQRHQSTIPK
jgi:predicted ATPase